MTEANSRLAGEDPALRPAWQRRAPGGADSASAAPPVPVADPPVAEANGAPAAADGPAGEPVDADDLDRGRTLALLATLGRLQMSLDVMSRQQRKHAEDVEQRLARIERALAQRPPG